MYRRGDGGRGGEEERGGERVEETSLEYYNKQLVQCTKCEVGK